MQIDQETVKSWLKTYHRNRHWLAEKCDVSPKTINNWLSSPRGIPSKAIVIIQSLMQVDEETKGKKVLQNLIIEFNDEEYSHIEKAALSSQMTVRDWAKQTLENAANEDIQSFAKRLSLVAEDPQDYSTENK